jgi:hypothetical protein
MSGLAALLAGHTEPDLYHWHNAAHVEDVRHAVEHAGWRFAYLDGWTVEDKDTFLKQVGASLDLDGDHADSFDALADALQDAGADGRGGTVLLWDGWSPFARADQEAFEAALSVLGGRVNAERGDRFAVLLRGEESPGDVPELPVGPH